MCCSLGCQLYGHCTVYSVHNHQLHWTCRHLVTPCWLKPFEPRIRGALHAGRTPQRWAHPLCISEHKSLMSLAVLGTNVRPPLSMCCTSWECDTAPKRFILTGALPHASYPQYQPAKKHSREQHPLLLWHDAGIFPDPATVSFWYKAFL